jgi:hypothetical protein
MLALASGDLSTYKLIPAGIEQTGGSVAVIASLALQIDRLVPDAPWGAQASYLCSYDVHTADPEGRAFAARTLPEFVASRDSHWAEWCSAWKVPDVSGVLSTDLVSDVPTLLFRGDLSPEGSAEWITKVLRGMSNAQAVVFPTLGDHLLADGPPCLSALRRKFLSHPGARLDTKACARQSPPIPFVGR